VTTLDPAPEIAPVRPAAPAAHDHGLDLLRAAAILSVLVFHGRDGITGLPDWFQGIAGRGWIGVDLFFVLSGFLVGGQALATSQQPYGRAVVRFWLRRWFRTFPLYYLVLLVYVVGKPLALHVPFRGDSLRYLLFGQNFSPMHDFIQSWSLCVEEHFYLLLPLIVFARRLPSWCWLAGAVVPLGLRALAWWTLRPDRSPIPEEQFLAVFSFNSVTHLDGLLVGVFLAAIRPRWTALSRRARRLIGVAGLVLVTLVCGFVDPRSAAGAITNYTTLSLGFAGLLVGASGLPRHGLGGEVVARIAAWSYGAYLWHGLLSRVMARQLAGVPWLLGYAIFLIGVFALAAATYQLVERPGLRVRDALLSRARRSPALGEARQELAAPKL